MADDKPAKSLVPRLDGTALDAVKIAAAVCMVVDHMNFIWKIESPLAFLIGRAAFPLFCYAVAVAVLKAGPAAAPRYAAMKYAPRMLLLGLVTVPVHFFIMDTQVLNVLFTLALGALFAGASLRMRDWQFSLCICLVFLTGFFPSLTEFGFIGAAVPALLIGAMQRRTGALPLLIAALGAVNMQPSPDDASGFTGTLEDFIFAGLVATATVFLPFLVLDFARRLKGAARWLPKYALHIFYPGHMILLWALYTIFAPAPAG